MEDVHSAGRVKYESAPPLPRFTLSKQIEFWIAVVIDVVTVLVLSVPIFFSSFKKLFVIGAKKCINGQTALITGGGNGIGRAIAFRLAEEKCNVAVADIDGPAAAETAKEISNKFNVKAVGYTIDVTDYTKLKDLKAQIENDIGPVDILVNNAGLMPLLSLREGPEVDVNRITAVNINANFWTVRTFISGMMKRKRGHIVGISSLSALHPMGGASIYTSTKFAVVGFMRAFQQEIRQEGYGNYIDFTTVFPYFVSTRKDLMAAVHLRFPAVTAEETAEATVKGILYRERSVVFPKIYSSLSFLVRSLPYRVECLIRDLVLKEKESRVFKFPNKIE